MIDNLRNIIMKIKNVSEVVVQSSDSYKKVSSEAIECGKDIKQSIENLTLGAKNTANEIQNITMSINDMENKSKELVASTLCFEEMVNRQENMFLNLKKSSEDLDELSASLSNELSKFTIK